jgi:glycosyltransferase involved in cell wall biosynthesis
MGNGGVLRKTRSVVRCALLLLSPNRLGRTAWNLLLWAKVRADPNARLILDRYLDPDDYLNRYPDVADLDIPARLHYIFKGYLEDRITSEEFDGVWYAANNPDVERAGVNPLLHYALFGAREERRRRRPERTVHAARPDGSQPSDGPSLLLALSSMNVGGAETLFHTLVKGLMKRGYRVSVITTHLPQESVRTDNRFFDDLTPFVYHFPELFANRKAWKEFFYDLLRQHKVSIVLMAGSDFVYDLLPAMAADFPHIRVIDQLFNDTGHIKNNRLFSGIIDLNLVPSRALADTLTQKYGEIPDKVAVIPHGVETEVPLYPSRAAAFALSGLPAGSEGKFLVSFFGRLSAEKSPRTFIEMARRLAIHPDMHFCLTGEGPERTAVLNLIAKYRLPERIHTPGFVADVRPLIAASDVVVVPSALDGMPLIVLEAQVYRKPVVASAIGSLPEMIADGVTGFICPVGDIEAFSRCIERLHETPEGCRAMGERAHAAATARYSAAAMVEAYVEAFEPESTGFRR